MLHIFGKSFSLDCLHVRIRAQVIEEEAMSYRSSHQSSQRGEGTKSALRLMLGLITCLPLAYAADDAAFEVASVRPTPRPLHFGVRICEGGPGTSNPGTWTCRAVNLSTMI